MRSLVEATLDLPGKGQMLLLPFDPEEVDISASCTVSRLRVSFAVW